MNKVNTKATLRWRVTATTSLPESVRHRFLARYKHRVTKDGEFVMSSQRYRDQKRNVEDCFNKLRALIADVAVEPKKRKATRPSAGSIKRRIKNKQHRSQTKKNRRPPSMD